jgi:hypothetical protein
MNMIYVALLKEEDTLKREWRFSSCPQYTSVLVQELLLDGEDTNTLSNFRIPTCAVFF